MAIDEVLLGRAQSAILRFYRWNQPAISFGYFVSFAEAYAGSGERPMVRRWTGGGIVPHGEDLTYSIIVPVNDPIFSLPSKSIYENVHRALCFALATESEERELVSVAGLYGRRNETESAVTDHRYNHCFANPVQADVMVNGRKIAGAAHRKTRNGLLHQGSIQREKLDGNFRNIFGKFLSKRLHDAEMEMAMLRASQEVATTKYETDAWLRRR